MTDAVTEPGTAFAAEVEAVRHGRKDVEQAASAVLAQLGDEELLWLLDGDSTMRQELPEILRNGYNRIPAEGGRVDRLGIPGVRFSDGPRGVVMGSSTSFPAAIARAAAFDTDLEHRIGAAIGAEARAQGGNVFGGVCVNLAPFPGWGRSQESYGEDPILLGAMGSALTEGVRPWMMPCVKHYALNSMEDARFTVDVRVAEDVLHEVYLPHFRSVVEAGADVVMSSYNSVNGEWAGQNHHLLTRILRDTWGFDGFVLTDFVWGVRDPVGSVPAGLDVEMPFRQLRAKALPAALREGRLSRSDVERTAKRLLSTQIRFAVRAEPTPPMDVVASCEHRQLAREAATLGSVLLRNEPVDGTPLLPLAPESRIAVLGRLADKPNQGDVASSNVRTPDTVSVLQGLSERLGDRVVHTRDQEASVRAAEAADTAVVVVGLSAGDEGESLVGIDAEAAKLFGGFASRGWVAAGIAALARMAGKVMHTGGDRTDLHLHREDVELITAVRAANPRTVVVVIGGGTIMPDPWDEQVPAILFGWYPGMEGGRAVADVLFGDAEPGGRLPVAIPRRRTDLPTVDWKSRQVAYPRWFGQRKLDHDGTSAAYPFGHGLGYTGFSVGSLRVEPAGADSFRATVTVTNTGSRRGRHVVQLYVTQHEHDRLPARALAGFQPVVVDPGEETTVTLDGTTRPMQVWSGDGFTPGVTEVLVEAASHAGDPQAVTAQLRIPG